MSTQCSKCSGLNFLKGGNTCTTDCGGASFGDPTTKTCKPCGAGLSCTKCSDASKCTECVVGKYLTLAGTCVDKCDDGYYEK